MKIVGNQLTKPFEWDRVLQMVSQIGMRTIREETTFSLYLHMRCPICRREFEPAESTALPFCSKRCWQIDLGRWLGEGYSVPVQKDPEDYEEEEGQPPKESDED